MFHRIASRYQFHQRFYVQIFRIILAAFSRYVLALNKLLYEKRGHIMLMKLTEGLILVPIKCVFHLIIGTNLKDKVANFNLAFNSLVWDSKCRQSLGKNLIATKFSWKKFDTNLLTKPVSAINFSFLSFVWVLWL